MREKKITANNESAEIAQRREERAKRRLIVRAQKDMHSLKPVMRSMVENGTASVVTMQGADNHRFKLALKERIKSNGGSILWLPAEGNLQGTPLDEVAAEVSLKEISKHRRESTAFSVIAFEGVKFGQETIGGAHLVTRQLGEIIRQSKSRYSFHHTRHELGVLAIGSGRPSDLLTHPNHNHGESNPKLNIFEDGHRLALTPDFKLTTFYMPNPEDVIFNNFHGFNKPNEQSSRTSLEYPEGGPTLGEIGRPGHKPIGN